MGTTHQRGYVTARGKQWYRYYRRVVNDPATDEQKNVCVPVILGPKSSVTKFEAREALQREITKQVGQPGSPTRVMNDGSVTFADQDFLTKDPARKVKIPPQLRETDTTSLNWDQLRSALDALTPRDRILLELDMTNALRPSELFALKWKCFDAGACAMSVSETVYKGSIRPWGKTKKSLSVIHIPPTLAKDLRAWKAECPDSSPEAFIFANQARNFMDTDNYRKRVLHKIARDLKLPKLTFQVIRRTIATLAQKKGSVKDVQGLMRHSRTATTTDVYMQEILESVQSTVNSIHLELRKTSQPKGRKSYARIGPRKTAACTTPVWCRLSERFSRFDTK